ncbi:thioredoxin-like fold [Trichoderma arundinaceum]|uniref:thioredoxin-dependent peroxiredoxin n=1 Tax=Trichoderma arundinaceum TaxID=490622 RepID=A0A395N9Y3_TRIAR|nr:thioredoxin-like fold [Trichoderma arundinaceum]
MAATLASELQKAAEGVAAHLPEAAKNVIFGAREGIQQKFDIKSTIQPGEKLPDFILSDARGEPVSSVDLLAKGPVLITFYRGGWCPFCNLALRAFQQRLEEFQARGVTLVAITPEQPDSSLTTAEKNELKFPVLTDDGLKLANKLGIVWTQPEDLVATLNGVGIDLEKRNGNGSAEMVIPTTLLVDQKGVVRNIFAEADWMKRLEPQEAVNWVNAL